jgi:hypothetical protein
MMKVRVSLPYVGPLCGDCQRFARCKGESGIQVRDRPCGDFLGLDGR